MPGLGTSSTTTPARPRGAVQVCSAIGGAVLRARRSATRRCAVSWAIGNVVSVAEGLDQRVEDALEAESLEVLHIARCELAYPVV